jgi:hypothetical protein
MLETKPNYTAWKDYFTSNQHHFDHINWNAQPELSENDKRIVTKSLQQFQRGEYSEGKTLMHFANIWDAPDYPETVELFIREEQRHAMVLGRYMKNENIARTGSDWVDGTFRFLRKLAGLENSVMVLITAEIIAAVYYKALMNAVKSETLTELCKQILQDEEMHINFQSHTLNHFYKQHIALVGWLLRFAHNVLTLGTIAVVWLYHAGVLRRGGYGFLRFTCDVMSEFLRSERMILGNETASVRDVTVLQRAFVKS